MARVGKPTREVGAQAAAERALLLLTQVERYASKTRAPSLVRSRTKEPGVRCASRTRGVGKRR
jgi:hypothetical protein